MGGGVWLFGGAKAKHKVTYATATIHKGEISESVTATGTIEPVTEVEVGTQVSGIIDKIHVDYNSVVTKGQLIAEMDRVTLQSELASQRAAYNGAKAEYEYQKKLYERNKTLFDNAAKDGGKIAYQSSGEARATESGENFARGFNAASNNKLANSTVTPADPAGTGEAAAFDKTPNTLYFHKSKTRTALRKPVRPSSVPTITRTSWKTMRLSQALSKPSPKTRT